MWLEPEWVGDEKNREKQTPAEMNKYSTRTSLGINWVYMSEQHRRGVLAPEAEFADQLDSAVEEVQQTEIEPTDGKNTHPHDRGADKQRGCSRPENETETYHPDRCAATRHTQSEARLVGSTGTDVAGG